MCVLGQRTTEMKKRWLGVQELSPCFIPGGVREHRGQEPNAMADLGFPLPQHELPFPSLQPRCPREVISRC